MRGDLRVCLHDVAGVLGVDAAEEVEELWKVTASRIADHLLGERTAIQVLDCGYLQPPINLYWGNAKSSLLRWTHHELR